MEIHHQEQANTYNQNLPSTTKWRTQYNKWDFTDDITELLVNKLPQYQNSIILGDFNTHIEDQTNADAVTLNDIIRPLGLKQHISGPTHVKGNTLDLIFIQLSNSFGIINTTLHGFISDHCMVSVDINIKKQKYPIETKKIRDRTKITGPTFAQNFTPPEVNGYTPLMKPTVNLTWNCSKNSMQLHPSKA